MSITGSVLAGVGAAAAPEAAGAADAAASVLGPIRTPRSSMMMLTPGLPPLAGVSMRMPDGSARPGSGGAVAGAGGALAAGAADGASTVIVGSSDGRLSVLR